MSYLYDINHIQNMLDQDLKPVHFANNRHTRAISFIGKSVISTYIALLLLPFASFFLAILGYYHFIDIFLEEYVTYFAFLAQKTCYLSLFILVIALMYKFFRKKYAKGGGIVNEIIKQTIPIVFLSIIALSYVNFLNTPMLPPPVYNPELNGTIN